MDELDESRLVLRHFVLAPLLIALAIGVAFTAHKNGRVAVMAIMRQVTAAVAQGVARVTSFATGAFDDEDVAARMEAATLPAELPLHCKTAGVVVEPELSAVLSEPALSSAGQADSTAPDAVDDEAARIRSPRRRKRRSRKNTLASSTGASPASSSPTDENDDREHNERDGREHESARDVDEHDEHDHEDDLPEPHSVPADAVPEQELAPVDEAYRCSAVETPVAKAAPLADTIPPFAPADVQFTASPFAFGFDISLAALRQADKLGDTERRPFEASMATSFSLFHASIATH